MLADCGPLIIQQNSLVAQPEDFPQHLSPTDSTRGGRQQLVDFFFVFLGVDG